MILLRFFRPRTWLRWAATGSISFAGSKKAVPFLTSRSLNVLKKSKKGLLVLIRQSFFLEKISLSFPSDPFQTIRMQLDWYSFTKKTLFKKEKAFFVELFCCDLRDGNHRVTLGLIASNRYEAVTNLVDLGHESVGVNAKRLYRIETDLQFDPLF